MKSQTRRARSASEPALIGDPLWYKDAILYEVPVRAFADSDGDGVGDFRGLLHKLDYLEDLGVTALWLLPFYPSPLRDDGYDIADYTDVHPLYGSLPDFRHFLREAHRRGLRVITELVINHTSDQHPWFQNARRAKPGDPARDFYVWSDTADRYREARIIFKDFEPSNWSWDPVARAYYWHRFYSHQPDLNFDNPRLHEAVFDVVDFWLGLGVDGMRLDAVPYLYEREGTNCENLPETHAFLKALRRHVDDRFPGRMLVAEANQWPEDAVAYFGQGDECHLAFHFPVMPRLFLAIRMEDRLPILDIMGQTPAIPDSCQWALFLRNHDELTLEMVTDEERDYVYRVYAHDPRARINLGIRRRLAPLLENHRSKIELMNGLLFSLPGTPVLYYGDEIGMGDNIYLGDRNGVRTPMQWSGERNAGFNQANPQALFLPVVIDPEYHYEAVNVEVQQNNPHSLLWWTKRLIHLRKRHPAFGRGDLRFLTPDNHKVLAFVRTWKDNRILVVANLSRLPQYVTLDLSAYAGHVPIELFGQTPFPRADDRPYLLTLGSYAFYWFQLEPPTPRSTSEAAGPARLATLDVEDRWENVLAEPTCEALFDLLPGYLSGRTWFNPDRQPDAVRLVETFPLSTGAGPVLIAFTTVTYAAGDAETYVLPLAFAPEPEASRLRAEQIDAVLCNLQIHPRRKKAEAVSGVLYDPLGNGTLGRTLLDATLRARRFKRPGGELVCLPLTRSDVNGLHETPEPTQVAGRQHNTLLAFGDRYVLKVFRRIEEGVNPEVEVRRFLAEKTAFAHVPRPLGLIQYRRPKTEPIDLALLSAYVPHQSDGWTYCLDALVHFFEQALARQVRPEELALPHRSLLDLAAEDVPALAGDAIGHPLEAARLLGQRTGELHLALASAPADSVFAPEPFTTLYQRSLYQSLRAKTRQAFVLLRRALNRLPDAAVEPAVRLEGEEEPLLQAVRVVYERKIAAQRLRCHGNYGLREVLYDGKDFTVIDLGGQPNRPFSARRRKYSPVRDVAGMIRSFDAVAQFALNDERVRGEDRAALEPWARFWSRWMAASFLRAYREVAATGGFLPESHEELAVLLDFYLIKRTVNDLRHGLERGSDRVDVPLQGLLQLLEARD
jgi:maltose alpha-D-glucosyltransferase / alpha-amylase